MASRLAPIVAAAGGFAVALAVSGWYAGLWERSPPPAVTASQPRALREAARTPNAVPVVPAAVPDPAPVSEASDSGMPQAAADPAASTSAEDDARERRRESRAARTR
jgi:hypothetical protein